MTAVTGGCVALPGAWYPRFCNSSAMIESLSMISACNRPDAAFPSAAEDELATRGVVCQHRRSRPVGGTGISSSPGGLVIGSAGPCRHGWH